MDECFRKDLPKSLPYVAPSPKQSYRESPLLELSLTIQVKERLSWAWNLHPFGNSRSGWWSLGDAVVGELGRNIKPRVGRKDQLSPERAPGGSKQASLLKCPRERQCEGRTGWIGMENAGKEAVQSQATSEPVRRKRSWGVHARQWLECPSGGKGAREKGHHYCQLWEQMGPC